MLLLKMVPISKDILPGSCPTTQSNVKMIGRSIFELEYGNGISNGRHVTHVFKMAPISKANIA